MTQRFWKKGCIRVIMVMIALSAILLDDNYPGFVARAWALFEICLFSIWAALGLLIHGGVIARSGDVSR